MLKLLVAIADALVAIPERSTAAIAAVLFPIFVTLVAMSVALVSIS